MRTSCVINVTLLTVSLAAAAATSSTSNRLNFLLFLLVLLLHPVSFLLQFLLSTYLVPGGPAWRGVPGLASRPRSPCGWPFLGTAPILRHSLAHRKLAAMAWSSSPSSTPASCRSLMPLSLGTSTRAIVSSDPSTAREILHSSSFADRPPKLAARMLMFDRAVGFSPSGEKWRRLRRAAVGKAFSPRGVAAQEASRSRVGNEMVEMIEGRATGGVEVEVRDVLRWGAVEGAVIAVLGDGGWVGEGEKKEIGNLVREAYEVMDWWGFGWEEYYLPEIVGGVVVELTGMGRRCRKLMQRVRKVFGGIIQKRMKLMVNSKGYEEEDSDLLGVLLACPKEEKLSDTDLMAVLWEMIFRGADVVAILMEWVMARMVLHTDVQRKAQQEIHTHVGRARPVYDTDVSSLKYLQAVVKETLRMHPPGPLMSWARLATVDTFVGKVFVPAGTVAMVNMWAIAHDEKIWKDPWTFRPERFLDDEGGAGDVTVTGSDLRLAPFGSGRRVCPGRVLALADVHLWVGRMLQEYCWVASRPVHLDEELRMSLEMKKPLVCRVELMQ